MLCVLCCVVCVVVVVVLLVVVVCVWCVCVLRHAEKNVEKNVCGFKNASVCTLKTSPCMRAPLSHVLKHMRVVPVHTGTF